MNSSIAYIGTDESFSLALAKSAQLHKTPLEIVLPEQLPDLLEDNSPLLLVVDAQTPLLDHDIAALNAKTPPALLVLALPAAAQTTATMIPLQCNNYSDIILKPMPQELLDRKIQFYLACLGNLPASRQNDSPENPHTLAKKNLNLIHQVAHLQEQLSQLDGDLHIKREVLNRITQISQLSRQINCLDLDRISRVCIEQIPSLIAAKFASLYSFDAENGVMHLLRHNHPYTIDRLVVLGEHVNSPMAVAVKQRKLLLIRDLSEWSDNTDTPVTRFFSRNYQSKSCIIAPLMSGENTLGALNLADKIGGDSFDFVSDLPPVQLLCEIIGSAMSNIRLFEEVRQRARTDSMTGLVNHRTFYDELDKEVNRSRRYGNNLSLIIIDLDNLKRINDRHGHRAGDAVLLHVTTQISKCIRETDIPARYGGDEFAVILPNTSMAEAMFVAQRLVELVAATPVPVGNHDLGSSVSVGLAQYRKGTTIETFMNEADAALFEAKTSGKNRIQVFETTTS